MLTVIDLDSAIALADAKAAEWDQEFELKWNGPLIEADAVRRYLGLGDAERQALKALDPALVARLEQRVDELKRKIEGRQ